LPCKKTVDRPKGGFPAGSVDLLTGRYSDPRDKFCAAACNVSVSAADWRSKCPSE
jgi:hypothetical protein